MTEYSTGQRIRECIQGRGITQAELARRTSLPRSMINEYINDKYLPKIDNLTEIAKILGVTVDFLTKEYDYTYKEMKRFIELRNEAFNVRNDWEIDNYVTKLDDATFIDNSDRRDLMYVIGLSDINDEFNSIIDDVDHVYSRRDLIQYLSRIIKILKQKPVENEHSISDIASDMYYLYNRGILSEKESSNLSNFITDNDVESIHTFIASEIKIDKFNIKKDSSEGVKIKIDTNYPIQVELLSKGRSVNDFLFPKNMLHKEIGFIRNLDKKIASIFPMGQTLAYLSYNSYNDIDIFSWIYIKYNGIKMIRKVLNLNPLVITHEDSTFSYVEMNSISNSEEEIEMIKIKNEDDFEIIGTVCYSFSKIG